MTSNSGTDVVFTPQSRDDAIALTLLFGLSEFDGSRDPFRLRNNITTAQVETAQRILDWAFDVQVPSHNKVLEMCRYLRLKRNKYQQWSPLMYRPHEARNNRHGACRICGTYAQLCQLPKSYANEHNWRNREDAEEVFGLCLVDRILNFTLNGFLQFDWPTGWVLLDVRVKNFYDRWIEVTPFPADADD